MLHIDGCGVRLFTGGAYFGAVALVTLMAIAAAHPSEAGQFVLAQHMRPLQNACCALHRVAGNTSLSSFVDSASGAQVSLPNFLLGSAKRESHGTNWTSPDGSINVDTLRFRDRSLSTLYETLRRKKGRQISEGRLGSERFVLRGVDRDETNFVVVAQSSQGEIRGLSIVYSNEGFAGVANMMVENFDPFPGSNKPQYVQQDAAAPNTIEQPVVASNSNANAKIAQLENELALINQKMRDEENKRQRQDEERKRIEREDAVRKEEQANAKKREDELRKQIDQLKKIADARPVVTSLGEGSYGMPNGKRVALVVGINRYTKLDKDRQLHTALRDQEAMSQAFQQLNFVVIEARDVTRSEFNQKWQEFLNSVEPGGVAAFYFAGHGVQMAGANFLLASDTPSADTAQESLLRKENLDFMELREELSLRQPRLSLMILDACRNNPYRGAAKRSAFTQSRGLARIDAAKGTFVMYSAEAGETALDRLPGEDEDAYNSLYTRRLVPLLTATDLPLQSIALRVRSDVRELAAKVGHEQTPAYYDGLIGTVCLRSSCSPTSSAESKK